MGRIIADIVVMGSVRKKFGHLLDQVLPHVSEGTPIRVTDVGLVADYRRCSRCHRDLAMVFSKTDGPGKGDEIHLIMNPCTRVVLGIHPDEMKKTNLGSTAVTRDFLYFCAVCTGQRLPELICNGEVKELMDRLHQKVIVDMPEYISGKGHWVTVTEFPFVCEGRFLNLQTNRGEYQKIMLRIDWLRR